MSGEGPVLDGALATFFGDARVVRMASVAPDGSAHVVPVSPVLDLDHVIVASEVDTAKVRNVLANPMVSLCADDYDEDWSKLRSVVVFGEAQVIDSGFEWERDRTLLYEKYPQYPTEAPIEEGTTVMLDVRIDRVVSWGF
jgi:nitroimidazol reductase NimA-like FMN-containing flavoprotein (pyridoxamine 5'-phosphate oxidase superfamily)